MDDHEAISELRVTPDRYLPHRYAGAAEDFNPVHLDAGFARSIGLAGNILHGLYSMALVARAGLDAVGGDPRRLKRLEVQFRGTAVPEQEIVVRGSVTGRDADGVHIETTADQGETPVIRRGRFTARAH